MTCVAAKFDFEGELLTVRQICERVPALTDAGIRSHLKAGRNTTQAMLTYDSSHVRRANGKKAAKRARGRMLVPTTYRSSETD
ncbi:MAG TPA: hypothetical protein VJM50_24025 [Pyrinomonadaceae bacterium]|nr:hypothetical protein [Pyrinomonadaceae bacterium]